MCGHTRGPVIYSKFHRNPFRGFGTPGGQHLAFPITLASRFYNSLYYRRSRDKPWGIVTGTGKFDRSLGQILHDELHWLNVPDRVFFKLAVTVHRYLNGRATLYLSNYCVPAAGVDTRQHLRSANRQLLAVPRYRLNTYGRLTFSVAGPTVWNSLPDFIRDPTLSDVYLTCTCTLDTSVFSALEVLDDNRAL